MTLTSVVLPAPFGPIRPWIDPCSTSSDTPSTARTPPKCRWTLSRRRSTNSIPSWPPGGPDDGQPAAADDALRPEDDDGDQEETGDDVDVSLCLHEDPGQGCHHERTDHRTDKMTAAAEHGEAEDLHRPRHAVLLVARVDEGLQVRLERSPEPGQDRAQHEGDHLVARDVDALAQRSELVLADGGPRSAEPALGQPPHQKQHDGQADQHQVDSVERVRTYVFQA